MIYMHACVHLPYVVSPRLMRAHMQSASNGADWLGFRIDWDNNTRSTHTHPPHTHNVPNLVLTTACNVPSSIVSIVLWVVLLRFPAKYRCRGK